MAELTLLRGRFERPPRDPPVVVATKLRPPRAPEGLVPRPRLLRLLDEGGGRALTLVGAPGGFGKTTLLAQWWAQSRARPVAWLSLDARDRDPFRAWAHVAAALAGCLPQLRPLTAPDLPLDSLVPRLAAEVSAGPPAALVLDDYERLGRGASEGSLRWFAEQTVPTLQVVVSTRARPPFRLGLMRARGELVELGPVDLRLTEVEKLALTAHAGCTSALLDGMEGWPAGVRAGLLGPAAVASLVSGELARIGEEARRFLLEASVLGRLTGPTCDEALGRDDSLALLRALEQETPFLVALDDGRRSFRPRRALARALRSELHRSGAAAVPSLHLRAASAHRRRGETGPALEHALAAGAWSEAAALIRRTWRGEVDRGRHERALARLELLPEEALGPRLELVRAWLLHLVGRRDEGLAALDAAVGRAPARSRPLVEREAELVRSAFCWDGPVDVEGAAGPVAAWAAGWSLWWRGRPDEAAAPLEAACDGPPLVACAARCVLSRIAASTGSLRRALQLARDACALAEEHGLVLGMAPAAHGAMLAARGDTAAAGPLLEEALRLRRSWGHPLEIADSLILLAPVAAARDGRPRAAALLAEARALLDECGDPGSLGVRLAQARREALPRPGRAADSALTERERTVLRLLAGGLTQAEIAADLGRSFNTVHSHTKSIYRKLHASSRLEAVACGEAQGLC